MGASGGRTIGSASEFWENRIIWVGDDPTDEELASIECKVCGATYYARSYYRRRFGKLEDDDEESHLTINL